jgi:NSS family neurotransmitter:Na+ symporter
MYRWKKHNFNAELDKGAPKFKKSLFERYVNLSVGTFIPVILLIIFVNTVAVKYFGISLLTELF